MGMDDYSYHLFEEARAGRLSRRQLLNRGLVAGISAPILVQLLAACGSSSSDATSSSDAGGGLVTTGGSKGPETTNGPATTAGQAKRGGSIIIALGQPGASIDPVTMNQVTQYQTVQCAAEYLCFPDEKFDLQPQLATKWTSADAAKTWTFTLRPGVLFQDGTPMTAKDVVASIERVNNPKNNSGALAAFAGILSPGKVEAQGDDTVVFHLDRSYVDFPYLLSAFNAPSVILPANYEIGSFTKGHIGTGPFIMTSYTPTVGAQFERNPKYWAPGKPYLDSLQIKFFADGQTSNLALQAGKVDIIPDTSGDAALRFSKRKDLHVLQSQGSIFSTLQMRVDELPFKDLRLRQAIAYGIDRPALLKAVYKVSAELGNDHAFAPVFPDSEAVIQAIPQRPHDIAKAKALVAQAGFQDGFHVTLTTNKSGFQNYSVALKQMLKPAGILLTVKLLDDATWYGSGANQPWLEVPFGITGWASRGTASQIIESAFVGSAVWNSAHWKNSQFDALVKQFEAQEDVQARRRAAVQIAKIQYDDVANVIPYWQGGVRAIRTRVNGLAAGPSTSLDASTIWVS